MATKPLRTAVIGVGYLGRFHAQKYAQLPEADLVAVVDKHLPTAQKIAQELNTQALTDYHELIGKVDAVNIVTPTPFHFPIAKFFLTQGIHVLIEKPITLTLDEADELITLAKQYQCILQVGHLERFNPALLELKKHIHQPAWLESRRMAPFQLRGTDVNIIYDLMIHDLDIILSLIDSPLKKISASGACVFSDALDVAQAQLIFENGCAANLTASRIHTHVERSLHVLQKEMSLLLNFQHATLLIRKKGELPLPQHEFSFTNKDTILAEISAFLHAINTQSPPPVTGEEGRRALDIANRITLLIEQKEAL